MLRGVGRKPTVKPVLQLSLNLTGELRDGLLTYQRRLGVSSMAEAARILLRRALVTEGIVREEPRDE